MIIESNGGSFPYFVWPDINYFPASGNRDEDVFWRRFQNGMSWILTPAFSLFGIGGNVLNIVIMVRGKLTKSSTWLILALAVADTAYLLGTNNIPIHFYTGEGEQFGFDSRRVPAHALYHAYVVQVSVELCSKIVVMTLPSLITFDRLVAVFLPFRYTKVMSVKRVLCVVGLLYLLTASYAALYSLKYALKFTSGSKANTTSVNQREEDFPVSNGSSIGLIAWSEFYAENEALHRGLVRALVYAYSTIPLFFTCLGCLAVGVRIKSQANKRRSLNAFVAQENRKVKAWSANVCQCFKRVSHPLSKGSLSNENCQQCMTLAVVKATDSIVGGGVDLEANRNPREVRAKTADVSARRKNNKTTRVLLSVCGMYCIANTINFTVLTFFNAANVSSGMAIGLEMSRKFVLVLNSACNFLFYVGLNRNFRESYRKLFGLGLTQALAKK